MKLRTFTLALLVTNTITLSALTGCSAGRELTPNEEYDIVEPIQTTKSELSSMGLTQTLDVPDEKFKLVTEYTCDSAARRAWRVTSDKFLYLKVYTKDLNNDIEVYIDNIHIDTSIK